MNRNPAAARTKGSPMGVTMVVIKANVFFQNSQCHFHLFVPKEIGSKLILKYKVILQDGNNRKSFLSPAFPSVQSGSRSKKRVFC
jgi:hypothetical protein